jgi:O-antigen/teichoic acid export membrane protein
LRIPFLKHFDVHMQEVVRGAGAAFMLRVIGAGFGFLFNVLLARLLGAEGTGVYYLAVTVAIASSIVGTVGLDLALLRFTAANMVRSDWNRIAGAYRLGLAIATGASVAIALIIFVGASWIAQVVFSNQSLTGPLRLMALGIPLISLLTLHAGLLKGLRRITDAVLVQGLGVQLVSLLVLALIGGALGVYGAILAFVSANFLVLLLGISLWWRATPLLRGVRGNFRTRLLLGTSFPLLWVASMNMIMTWTDMIMIGIWMDSKSVGIYGAAMRLAMLTDFILVAVSSIVAPKFAALHAQNDNRALGALASHSARLMALLALPPSLVLLVAPGFVLGIFGPEFQAGAPALVILTVGQFINVATGSVGYLLIMTGHEKIERNLAVGFALVNVLLNLILIPTLGIEGAALSTGTSLALQNLIAYAIVRKKAIGRVNQ